MKGTILLRCLDFDDRVGQMIDEFERTLPQFEIILVPDRTGENHGCDDSEIISDHKVLPITQQWIADQGLHTAHPGAYTGWLCGDYVFYRALEEEWDYAWLVEPDVYFLNGSVDMLRRLGEFDHDLIATKFGPATQWWFWTQAWRNFDGNSDAYAMNFPLVRCSRRLAVDALTERRRISQSIRPDISLYPNDEVLLASVAVKKQRSVLNLTDIFFEQFRYWSTTAVANIDDLAEYETSPQVVHSGKHKDEFMTRVTQMWHSSSHLDQGKKKFFLQSLASANKSTVIEFVEYLWDASTN